MSTHKSLVLQEVILPCVCQCFCWLYVCGLIAWWSCTLTGFSEVPVWTPVCNARFSQLHTVLVIAAGFWKLRNRDCTIVRLLTSPTFLHSHFQRFQRFWSAYWWWSTAEAGGQGCQGSFFLPALSISFLSVLTESVMGLEPLLFIAEIVKEVLGRAARFCLHANS